jgi:hypothetical protein
MIPSASPRRRIAPFGALGVIRLALIGVGLCGPTTSG